MLVNWQTQHFKYFSRLNGVLTEVELINLYEKKTLAIDQTLDF